MSKKISKLLLALLLVILTIFSLSICYADINGDKTKAVTISETEENVTTTSEDTTEDEIYSGDLYLFDNDIVMDKLVDGNVFIFGDTVKITGQVNGNLFVFADNVTFGVTEEEKENGAENNCYIRYSIFACANSVYYNAGCNDLYVATNDLEMTYDSYVVRDLKAVSSNAVLKSAIGRDVDLLCNNVNFGEGTDIPVIYGNLRYSANKEVELPEGVLTEGTSTYTKSSITNNNFNSFSITDTLFNFAITIATVLILYFIFKKSTPNFVEKLNNFKISANKLFRAFLIGLVSIIVIILLFVLLLLSTIGTKLAFVLALSFVVLCLVANPIFSIIITNILKPILKIEKKSIFFLTLVLVSIILYGITLIPFVGGIIGFIINMIAIGLLIDMYLPHKELTDEEKLAIENAKKQANADREKRKQEKLEAKKLKKENKHL